MNYRKSIAAVCAAVMAAAAVVPAFAEEQEVQKGGTLVVAFPQSAATFDNTKYSIQHEANCFSQVTEGLFMWSNDQSSFVPLLGTEWSVSEDGKTYYFTIRDNVCFSNGRKMTAADVKYSFDRASKSTGQDCIARGYYESTEVIDDTHVAVHLTAPCGPFMNYIASTSCPVIPQEEVEAAGDEWGRSILVGTGPFLFKEFVTDEYVLFEKNPNYWGGEPNVDGIKALFITDPIQMFNAIRTGEVHIGFDMSGDAIGSAQKEGILYQAPSMAMNWIRFNLQNGPTADPRVRKALMMAVDTEEMNEGIYQYGEAENIFLPMPPTLFAYDESLAEYKVEYDPEGAMELLKEAGYGKGLTLNMYFPSSANRNKMAQIIQAYYDEIGVKLNLISSTTPEFSATCTEGWKTDTINITAAAWNANPDPHFFVTRFFHSKYLNNISNCGGYNRPDVDEMLDNAFISSDMETRKQYYHDALVEIMKDYTGYYYSNELRNYGINPKVHDAVARGDNRFMVCTPLNNVWIEQ